MEICKPFDVEPAIALTVFRTGSCRRHNKLSDNIIAGSIDSSWYNLFKKESHYALAHIKRYE